ncbi:MAG: MucR family transcriptional regulator [Alphaproteobacteria bacterium]|nr:MucR family transcriptional regulator [Alphaproteobacteria bacterium]
MSQSKPVKPGREELLRMTADVVAAYVSNNSVTAPELPKVIETVFGSLSAQQDPDAQRAVAPRPAVPVNRSVATDFIVCLEDGKKLKMLKRHLRAHYNLTPEQYRVKWGLPPDYPMVAPSYAARRSAVAKKIGLGRSRALATRDAAE